MQPSERRSYFAVPLTLCDRLVGVPGEARARLEPANRDLSDQRIPAQVTCSPLSAALLRFNTTTLRPQAPPIDTVSNAQGLQCSHRQRLEGVHASSPLPPSPTSEYGCWQAIRARRAWIGGENACRAKCRWQCAVATRPFSLTPRLSCLPVPPCTQESDRAGRLCTTLPPHHTKAWSAPPARRRLPPLHLHPCALHILALAPATTLCTPVAAVCMGMATQIPQHQAPHTPHHGAENCKLNPRHPKP